MGIPEYEAKDTKAALKIAGFFYPFILTIPLGPRKQRKSWSALAHRMCPRPAKLRPTKTIRLVFAK
jgi:hypothetical protein